MPKEVRALLFSLLVVTLAACSLTQGGEQEATAPPDTPTSTREAEEAEEPETRQADVESIEVLVLESFPVQVNVIASGTLPDACTTLNEPTPRLEGNTFVVNLTATRLPEEVCSQAEVPFDKVIQLDAEGLSAGTYTVSVNGVTGTFTLEADNVAGGEGEGEPTPTAVAPDADIGGIEGTVWHDLCSVSGGEGDEPLVPSDGCVALEQGIYQANGILETEEPGIAGIVVNLGEGACPATGLGSATTDDAGDFVFADLEPGTYCVSVDALGDNNSSILVPGDWTAPDAGEDGIVSAEVTVNAGDVAGDANFGWDYENLPEPGEEGATEGEATAEGDDCTDAAEFVADVTVQDNEVLPPGFVFTKTWRLANSGTCTWTSDYDLVFAGGDRMGAPQAQPLPRPVAPNQAINLSVQMVAPQINGTYRSDWQLRNAGGELFGIPDEITFWVQIVVSAAIPEEGSTIAGLVWSDVCEVTDETPSAGCVDDGEGGFLANGTLDGGEPRIGGVSVALAEGACPATAVTSTTSTDEAGRYSFTGLEPGTYCVFINPEGGNNAGVLGDGTWTYPDVTEEIVSLTVEVVANDTASDINFGWDVAAE